jgi:deoxyribodipyrimidine photo-lyase
MASLLVSGSNTMQPVILWFRRNLRLADNAALQAAVEAGCPIIPLYIHDEEDRGSASRWWLHHSLTNLERKGAVFRAAPRAGVHQAGKGR